jgi:carboxyl-terminal processing protease
MKTVYYKLLFVFALSFAVFISCKKNTVSPVDVPSTNPAEVTASRDELTKDSIFLYSKELYYWNTSLPNTDTFNPRNYSSNEAELYALTQYPINPLTGKSYEYLADYNEPKYSYLEYVTNNGKKMASLKADVSGSANDFGFSVKYNTTNDLRVKYVYEGSSADINGLTRGCKIISINGNSNLSYTDAIVDFLNSTIFGSNTSIAIIYIDLNNNTKSVTISKSTYAIKPILFTKTYNLNGKKVGYVVFNSYTDNATDAINNTFTNFASEGITELIVDLRYNGGGYVSTAKQIIDFIAPASQTGNTMFTYYYNSYLSSLTSAQRKSSILVNQPILDSNDKLQTFTNGVNGKYATYADLNYSSTNADNIEKFTKTGSLALTRVYFLVSGSTASAAELTINSLKPVLDVKLIGSTTYGKPVGFFPIRIDKLDLYIPEFETKNQLGVGGYYSGLTVDKSAQEDLTKSWGDENETLLANALQYAKTGNYIITATKSASLKTTSPALSSTLSDNEIKIVDHQLDQNNFQGMIARPKKFINTKANN